ncbi:MAG TPA: hypothetical protein VM074_00785, partial [Solimonas sp.]|nr:hypothetical protein [Solimonas sp.]
MSFKTIRSLGLLLASVPGVSKRNGDRLIAPSPQSKRSGGIAMQSLTMLGRLAAAVVLFVAGAAQGQTLTEPQEWAERIKTAQSIGALGSDLFGDSTNFYNGQANFSATDIDLPGNSDLPVRLVRKLTTSPSLSDYARLLGNWDLDLPYMSGVYVAGRGWQTASGTFARCTGALLAPDVTVSGVPFSGHTYSRMISMNVPGSGSQTVLYPSSENNRRPSDGQSTRYVTSGFWQIRCLPQIANPSSETGFTGEAFEAVSPDGKRYRFDWMTRQYFPSLKRGYPNYVATMPREEIRLYATRVQDHRGNWVQYSYNGKLLTGITANDGRSIELIYDAAGHLKTATAHGRPWQYSYTAEDITAQLTGVALPDGSAWTLDGSLPGRVLYSAGPGFPDPPCGYPGSILAGQSATITLTHPSGATGQFVLTPLRRLRYATDNAGCEDDNPNPNTRYTVPKATDAFALASKAISGPGIASAYSWSMSYGCSGTTCSTQVTNPDGSRTKHTYGIHWYLNEGKLLRSEHYSPASVLLRDEVMTYATGAAIGPYPYITGYSGWEFEDIFADTRLVPRTLTTLTQASDTYTTQVNSFDHFARSTDVTRSNSFGGSRRDVTAYEDHYGYWLLGQVRSVTNIDTGLVPSSADYGATSARPETLYSFGVPQKTATYNVDGTLATLADGLPRTTRFADWKRGIPKSITYADSAGASAEVDDSGWITSVTDPNNATTSYGYDGVGRLSAITYPIGDTVAWSGKSIGYIQLSTAELGIPAGSWRAQSTEGRHQVTSYYDAMLRPVLEVEKDTMTGKAVYSKKAYDYEGRVTLESYPSFNSNPSAGITTAYDGLGRVTQTATTDGVTLSTFAYLSGNRKQVTDADGKVTTISYQAFDQPDDSRPTLIVSQEGQTTRIVRDVFGKINDVSQSGAYAGTTLSATRSFKYDAQQRPCRRIDPESGSTVWGYDAASQIAWEAKGQSGTACLGVAPAGATLFEYWPRGNKKKDDYPGTAEDVSYGYDAALNLTSVIN